MTSDLEQSEDANLMVMASLPPSPSRQGTPHFNCGQKIESLGAGRNVWRTLVLFRGHLTEVLLAITRSLVLALIGRESLVLILTLIPQLLDDAPCFLDVIRGAYLPRDIPRPRFQ